jgi:hypothetical protein
MKKYCDAGVNSMRDNDNKFWTCFVEGSGGGTYYRHEWESDAYTEAERLSRLPNNRGKKVYILEMVRYCEVPETPVTWHYPEVVGYPCR